MDVLLNGIDPVFLLEWALLCSIMVVASYTTYTDISHREIPNSATWTLLGLGLMGQMGLWIWGEVALVQIGLSFVLGFAVGYLLFMYGFWGAGMPSCIGLWSWRYLVRCLVRSGRRSPCPSFR